MKKYSIPVFSLLFVLGSCTTTNRYIYTASPPNNPYFEKKGDSKIAAYYSDNGNSSILGMKANGFDLQTGYAITDHISIIAGYYNRKEKESEKEYNRPSYFVTYKRELLDGGIGFFTPVNNKKTIFVNFYAGFGSGQFSFNDQSNFYENKLNKWFFQPAITFRTGAYVRFFVSPKVTYVQFKQGRTNFTADDIERNGFGTIRNRSELFFEPSLNIQLSLPQIPWLRVDGIISFVTNDYSGNSYDPYNSRASIRDGNLSIGLYFDFSKM